MPRQTAFRLLYDTHNYKQKGTWKIYNHPMYTQISTIIFFSHYIRMETTSQINGINAIKEARKFFNKVRSNLSREETNRIRKNSIKRKITIIF